MLHTESRRTGDKDRNFHDSRVDDSMATSHVGEPASGILSEEEGVLIRFRTRLDTARGTRRSELTTKVETPPRRSSLDATIDDEKACRRRPSASTFLSLSPGGVRSGLAALAPCSLATGIELAGRIDPIGQFLRYLIHPERHQLDRAPASRRPCARKTSRAAP